MSTDTDHMPRPPSFVDPTTEKGYELTGKIMMSAIIIVFAVVVVMVLLHIYARWYIVRNHRRGRRRRTHLVFYVEPANAVSSRGLDPALLKSLPTFVFSPAAGDEAEKVQECAVCLSEFEAGEKGRRLPKCNHSFHVDCIDMWFHSHSTCPLCRTTVDTEIPSPMKALDESLPVEIVVELSESARSESGTVSGVCTDCHPGPSSLGAKRKGLDLVGVSVDIPARTASFSFPNSDDLAQSSPAGHGFKSPTSRLLSFRRILSREKRPSPSPSFSSGIGIGTSCAELADIEDGRVESRATTPR